MKNLIISTDRSSIRGNPSKKYRFHSIIERNWLMISSGCDSLPIGSWPVSKSLDCSVHHFRPRQQPPPPGSLAKGWSSTRVLCQLHASTSDNMNSKFFTDVLYAAEMKKKEDLFRQLARGQICSIQQVFWLTE